MRRLLVVGMILCCTILVGGKWRPRRPPLLGQPVVLFVGPDTCADGARYVPVKRDGDDLFEITFLGPGDCLAYGKNRRLTFLACCKLGGQTACIQATTVASSGHCPRIFDLDGREFSHKDVSAWNQAHTDN